jgi:hypothetical protein
VAFLSHLVYVMWDSVKCDNRWLCLRVAHRYRLLDPVVTAATCVLDADFCVTLQSCGWLLYEGLCRGLEHAKFWVKPAIGA